jgi:hypothetical protein
MAKTKDDAAADATATEASETTEAAAPVAAPPTLEDRKATLATHVKERLSRAGLGEDVVVAVIGVDLDERGATVSVEAADLTSARFGVMTLLAGEDGREWTWRGSGPNVENGRFRAFAHVASF